MTAAMAGVPRALFRCRSPTWCTSPTHDTAPTVADPVPAPRSRRSRTRCEHNVVDPVTRARRPGLPMSATAHRDTESPVRTLGRDPDNDVFVLPVSDLDRARGWHLAAL